MVCDGTMAGALRLRRAKGLKNNSRGNKPNLLTWRLVNGRLAIPWGVCVQDKHCVFGGSPATIANERINPRIRKTADAPLRRLVFPGPGVAVTSKYRVGTQEAIELNKNENQIN